MPLPASYMDKKRDIEKKDIPYVGYLNLIIRAAEDELTRLNEKNDALEKELEELKNDRN